MNSATSTHSSIRLLAAGLIFAIGLAGCDAAQPESGAVRANLRFGAVLPAANLNGARLVAEAAVDPVLVQEVKLLVKSVRFHSAGDEEVEFKTGSFVVRIDPGSTASTAAIGEVPPGRYDRVTFQIHKPEDDEVVPDLEFRESASGQDRSSTIIRGTYLGQPFVVRIRDGFEQRVALSPALVVNEGDRAVDVTLLADVNAWFRSGSGRFLNPLVEGNQEKIADAIEDSFRGLSTKRGGHDDDDDDEDEDDE